MQGKTSTAPDPWECLDRELDAWADAGRIATFWLRDDDATRDGPKLRDLLEMAGDTPLCLAVIPAGLQPSLPVLIARAPAVTVLQHGFSHRNQARDGEKKSEFPESRDTKPVFSELRDGRARLEQTFTTAFYPVLVPPWNRIAERHRPALAEAGLTGLSGYADPEAPPPDERAIVDTIVDTHADIIDWRGNRGFLGDGPVLARLRGHLETRRMAAGVVDCPTGVLTHHIVHDAGCRAFLDRLTGLVDRHPAACWIDPFAAKGMM